MSTDVRQRLNAQQANLVAALTNHAAPPAGFDADRLALTAAALRRKRQRAAMRAWPELAALDAAADAPDQSVPNNSYATQFAKYAAAVPFPGKAAPWPTAECS